MLKKIAIGVLGLIVLLVAAVAIGPRFIDWNGYKGRVAEAVRNVTGRDLTIEGDMSLSLLPSPTLSVSGVRLANIAGGSAPDMARLKSLEVHVALVPLLSGKIQVTRVTLVDPVVLLERLADGQANWQFTPPPANANGAAGTASPGATAGSGPGAEISIDNFTIENGTVLYRAGGVEQKMEGLGAIVVMRSLTGPFTATGDAKIAGLPAKFDLAVDSLAGTGPIPIRGTINVAGDAAVLGFDGSADQAAAMVKGKVTAKLSDPGLVFKSAGLAGLPPGLTQPFTLSADLAASAASIELANLALSLGDSTAAGKISLQPGNPTQIAVNLGFSRLDLDKLLPPGAAPGGESTAAPATPAPSTPAPGTSTAGGFALPGQIVVDFDLSAEAVAYHQGVVTRPHLVGRLADGQLQIKQASALLPGGSDVNLAGTLAAKDGLPHFAGAIQAKSDNLRDLAKWLGATLPNVPADRLRSLTLTSRLIASPAQVELADLDMRLDASHIQGGVTAALPDGATRTKPGFGIGLTVDQLDVDAYLPPKKAGAAAGSAAGTGTSAPAKPQSPLAGLAALANLDANFDLRAGSLGFNGQTMRGLHLQGTLFSGKLTIADASAKDIGGGQGSIAGSIVNLASDPRYDLKLDLAAQDAARVFQLAGFGRQAPGKYGSLKLTGAVKGGADDVAFDIAFAVSGLGVDGAAKGTAQGLRAGVPRVDSTISVSAKNAAPVLQLLGLSKPGAEKLGAVSLTGKAASGKDSLDFDLALDLPGVGGKGALQGKLTGLSGTPQVATNLKLDVAQPAPLLALAGVGGPMAGKLGALGLAGRLDGGADAMKLALTLSLLGGNATVNGSVAAAKAPIAFDLILSADHPNLANLLAAVGGKSGGKGDLGALKVNVHLVGDAQKFAAKDLALKAGDSDLAGAANIVLGGRPQFAANFSSNNFNIATLSAGSAGGGNGGGGTAGQGQAAQGGGRWSRQPLDLSALDMADGVLDYKAARLLFPGNRIDDLVTRLRFAAGTLSVETLNGKIYGGSFDVRDGKLVGRGLPSFSGKVIAQNLELAQLAGTGTVKGPLSLNATLAASGASQAEMIGSLQGPGHVSGQVTILSKLEQTAGTALLGALGSQLKVLQGVTDKLGGVLQLFTGRPNDLLGDFQITHGVLATENTTLSNPAAKALFHGTANLPLWKLAMTGDIFKAPDMTKSVMTVNLSGALDKPSVNLTGALFQQNNQGTNPLQQLIPGLQPQTPAAPANGGTNPAPTATDPLQQLLNGLQPKQPTAPAPAPAPNPPPKPAPVNPLAPILQNLLGQPSGG
jgi:uncharacterized protein involved in outer membrane biogenesis